MRTQELKRLIEYRLDKINKQLPILADNSVDLFEPLSALLVETTLLQQLVIKAHMDEVLL